MYSAKSKSVKMLHQLTLFETKSSEPSTDLPNFKHQLIHKSITKLYGRMTRPTDSYKKPSSPDNSYVLSRTAFGSPCDKSTLISHIATPLEKVTSIERLKMIRGTDHPFKFRELQSTEDESKGEDLVKVNLVFPDKKMMIRYLTSCTTMKQIILHFQKDINDFVKRSKYALFGIIGFETVPFNYQLSHLINCGRDKTFEELCRRSMKEITITPCFLRKPVNYQTLQFSDFQIIKFLGSGGFSQVFLAKCKLDHQFCALKFIRKDTITTTKKAKMLQNEKNILFSVNHKNLIDLLYAFETKNYVVFGLEYCPNGNLYTYLQKVKNIPERQAKSVILQILSGLEYLHNNNILFRDIKLQNILFDLDGRIKITDFGLSKPDIGSDQITYSYCGSPEYMAPQMLTKSGHSFEIDFYALGILIYELLFGRSPFYATKKQEIFEAILHMQPKFPKTPIVSKEVKSLIKGLLAKNPSHRIGSLKGIKQITSHPWFKIQDQQNIVLSDKLTSQYKATATKELERTRQLFLEEQRDKIFETCFFQQNFVNSALCERVKAHIHKFKLDTHIKASFKKANYKRR